MATVKLRIFKLLSLVPVSTVVAIDLQLRAVISQMLVNSFDSLNNLTAAKALNLHALALVLDMLFKVFQEYALLNLVVVASMEDFDLAQHLVQELVLNFLKDRLRYNFIWSPFLLIVDFRLCDL
jgi:hypothetical protein